LIGIFIDIGCVISHQSFIYSIFGIAVAVRLTDGMDTKEPVRVMNYMPLAHMFGCGTIVAITYLGMKKNLEIF
jgi:long-subunit acyl-CoA synthetase (AMP-forming)